MIRWLEFTLRVWAHCNQYVAHSELLDRLSLTPDDPVVVGGPLGVPRVTLLRVAAEEPHLVNDPDLRMDRVALAIREGLARATAWLDRQDPEVFAGLRARGLVTDVWVGGWVSEARLLLDLPPEFLRACGRLGLTLTLCTNDWGSRPRPAGAADSSE